MKRALAFGACVCVLLSFVGLSHVRAAGVASIVVIVHTDNADALDKSTIKEIFLKQKGKWADGSEIKAVVMSGTDEAKIFNKQVLSKSTEDLAKYWSDKQAEDGTTSPPTKDSSEEVYKYVVRKKDRIGYVSTAYLDGLGEADRNKVKKALEVNSN